MTIADKTRVADVRGIAFLCGAELHIAFLAWAGFGPSANLFSFVFACGFVWAAFKEFRQAKRWRQHNGIA